MQTPIELIEQLNQSLTKSLRNIPRYKALYEALRQQILNGMLLPAMQLPSSRTLSQQLNLSRNTVITAIDQLCAEGYAITRPKSGVMILPSPQKIWHIKKPPITRFKFNLSARGKKTAILAKTQLMRGAFAPGIPDLKKFPFELWQRYVSRYTRNPKLHWLSNTNNGGEYELRQTLVNYLRINRGISCNADQILITHGTQHSLRLVSHLLTDHGDSVWIEDPGFPGARCAFEAAGLNIIDQPVDNEGLSPKKNAWQKPPRLIYITPSHQYPTGALMSAARRHQLLSSALKHRTCILEDDYDSEFRYEGAPIAALHALSPQQVIYLGTFSKTFFPALRIGYMVLPEHLIDAFRTTQARHDREPSYIIQKALADFIGDGHANAYIRKMRREYKERRNILSELLQSQLNGLTSLVGLDTGLHLVAYLPANLNDQEILSAADQLGIKMGAMTNYTHTPSFNKSALILGFGNADQQDISKAGKLLCQLIMQFNNNSC